MIIAPPLPPDDNGAIWLCNRHTLSMSAIYYGFNWPISFSDIGFLIDDEVLISIHKA